MDLVIVSTHHLEELFGLSLDVFQFSGVSVIPSHGRGETQKTHVEFIIAEHDVVFEREANDVPVAPVVVSEELLPLAIKCHTDFAGSESHTNPPANTIPTAM